MHIKPCSNVSVGLCRTLALWNLYLSQILEVIARDDLEILSVNYYMHMNF